MKSFKQSLASFSTRIQTLVDDASHLPIIGVLVRAGLKGRKDLNKDMSASIAYFTFLSLFPLILGLVAIGGFFLKSADVQTRLSEFLNHILPASAEFITQNIESIIRLRGAVGLASIIVLIWSARKMAGALSRAVNNTLNLKSPHAAYFSSIRNFGLTLIVPMLVLFLIALVPIIEILAEVQPQFIGNRANTVIDEISGHASGFLVSAILLSTIYLLIPFQRMSWQDLLPGILVATCLIELAKELFVHYVSTASFYSSVYGSLSSIIVMLIWLYFSARVVLYGAEVIAVNRESHVAHTDS